MEKIKIAVVEDELLIAFDIKQILELEGYDVCTNIVTFDEAIECADNFQPDLFLIDINLKTDKTGIDFGNYLLKRDQIPYIYITSYADKATLESVKKTRPYGFIVKPFKPEDISTMVTIVLNNFSHRRIDAIRQDKPIENDIPFRLKEIINYIHENIQEKIDINTLAELTNWKRVHFIKMFSYYIGNTPYQYILSHKIEKAKIMLKDTDLQASQIAFELGFQSYSNFCNAFKKLTSFTPENYRNKEKVKKFII